VRSLTLILWARSINKPELNITPEFASLGAGAQQSAEPYRKVFDVTQTITAEWTNYSYKASLLEDFKSNASGK